MRHENDRNHGVEGLKCLLSSSPMDLACEKLQDGSRVAGRDGLDNKYVCTLMEK
jgi:hypothetical protein